MWRGRCRAYVMGAGGTGGCAVATRPHPRTDSDQEIGERHAVTTRIGGVAQGQRHGAVGGVTGLAAELGARILGGAAGIVVIAVEAIRHGFSLSWAFPAEKGVRSGITDDAGHRPQRNQIRKSPNGTWNDSAWLGSPIDVRPSPAPPGLLPRSPLASPPGVRPRGPGPLASVESLVNESCSIASPLWVGW